MSVHHDALVEVRRLLLEVLRSTCTPGIKLILRAIGQGLYPLSHLAGPVTFIFNIYATSQVILVQVGLLHLGKNVVLNL